MQLTKSALGMPRKVLQITKNMLGNQKRLKLSDQGNKDNVGMKNPQAGIRKKRNVRNHTGHKFEDDIMAKTQTTDKLRNYTIIARLDDAIPLNTEEWVSVEQMLNQISEFVPMSMLNNLTEAIINYADDQARRGYLLGQEDLVAELKKKAAKIA